MPMLSGEGTLAAEDVLVLLPQAAELPHTAESLHTALKPQAVRPADTEAAVLN
ncbi:MAG: hypothetical protein ACKV22_40160 [Bryobacteraceae bacterium]